MFFKKISRKLLSIFFLFSISIMLFPTLIYAKDLIVGGENIGIEVRSTGVTVVGFYKIDNVSPGEKAGLKIGDRIVKVDNISISKIDEISGTITDEKDYLKITYIRNDKEYTTKIYVLKDEKNVYKTGLYVKNSIVGIGTITFIDPETKIYGALGHEIIDKTTMQRFELKDGTIYESTVTDIIKSNRNSPGEKNANINYSNIYGNIKKNTESGIFGKYTKNIENKNILEAAEDNEITTGQAYLKTVINGNKIDNYEINIIKINDDTDTKNLIFEIADKKLLLKTNGVVQGMSGSPIIQNNKLVGAVTHVIVDNPAKGYGIFISNMLKEIEN